MQYADITNNELVLLQTLKTALNIATKIESTAMAMIETDPSSEARLRAIDMLHNDTYQKIKTEITQTIITFHHQIERRTRTYITNAIIHQQYATALLIIISTLAALILWRLFYSVYQKQLLQIAKRRQQTLSTMLNESEKRFRLMTTNIKDYAIIMLDKTGHVSSWNIGAEQIKGYKWEETIGQPMSMFYPPDAISANKPASLLEQARHQGRVESECWLRRKNGNLFYANVIINATYDETGKLIGFAKITRDITTRKQAEQALYDSETRFRQLITTSPLPMLLTSPPPDSNILFMNESFTKLFGYTKQDVRDVNSWWPCAYPDPVYRVEIQKRWIAAIDAMQVGGKRHIQPVTARVTCKNGSVRYIEVYMTVLPDQGAIVVFHDFTKRKQIEQALVEEKNKAKAANQAKSNFLANMSHEIRTPMNAVIGLAQLLMETKLNYLQQDYVKRLINSAQSLLGILNDILDYSKIEANKLNLEAIDIDLTELIKNSTDLFSFAAEEKGIKLIFTIDPQIPPALTGDPLRLKQILNNLLGNAIKFTNQGHVKLTINLIDLQDDNVTIKIVVDDTGIGMSSDQVTRLFQAFDQADTSTTRRFGGSGLGLAITKRLIKMMQGHIEVKSTLGKGSTFSLTLKLPISNTIINQEDDSVYA
ncbi:hypothetical protein TI03_03825, partial [Achromatium sp. WMS1]